MLFMRERPAASIALPAPAPLPSLSAAFSRRAAIFGAAVTTGALAGSAGRALAPMAADADRRLSMLADAMTEAARAGDAAMAGRPEGTWGDDVPGWNAACVRFNAALMELRATPAVALAGVEAKSRALLSPWAAECTDTAAEIGASLAADLLRIGGSAR